METSSTATATTPTLTSRTHLSPPQSPSQLPSSPSPQLHHQHHSRAVASPSPSSSHSTHRSTGSLPPGSAHSPHSQSQPPALPQSHQLGRVGHTSAFTRTTPSSSLSSRSSSSSSSAESYLSPPAPPPIIESQQHSRSSTPTRITSTPSAAATPTTAPSPQSPSSFFNPPLPSTSTPSSPGSSSLNSLGNLPPLPQSQSQPQSQSHHLSTPTTPSHGVSRRAAEAPSSLTVSEASIRPRSRSASYTPTLPSPNLVGEIDGSVSKHRHRTVAVEPKKSLLKSGLPTPSSSLEGIQSPQLLTITPQSASPPRSSSRPTSPLTMSSQTPAPPVLPFSPPPPLLPPALPSPSFAALPALPQPSPPPSMTPLLPGLPPSPPHHSTVERASPQISTTTGPEEPFCDGASVDSLMSALYESMSFLPGETPDWDRLKSLFVMHKSIISVVDQVMSVAEFLAATKAVVEHPVYAKGYLEVELARRMEVFGNMAQVFSTYEARKLPENPIAIGINSVQLIKMQGRWWILSLASDVESSENKLPSRYLPSSLLTSEIQPPCKN